MVMSPWELNSHFGLLFADVEPHPNLQRLRAATQRFTRTWQGLWFRYGDAPAGHDEFRRLLASYIAETRPLAEPIRLKNELNWHGAMQVMIGRSAVQAGTKDAIRQRDPGDYA
jgi:hypothetical protein